MKGSSKLDQLRALRESRYRETETRSHEAEQADRDVADHGTRPQIVARPRNTPAKDRRDDGGPASSSGWQIEPTIVGQRDGADAGANAGEDDRRDARAQSVTTPAFDRAAYQRAYMREYMRKRRAADRERWGRQ